LGRATISNLGNQISNIDSTPFVARGTSRNPSSIFLARRETKRRKNRTAEWEGGAARLTTVNGISTGSSYRTITFTADSGGGFTLLGGSLTIGTGGPGSAGSCCPPRTRCSPPACSSADPHAEPSGPSALRSVVRLSPTRLLRVGGTVTPRRDLAQPTGSERLTLHRSDRCSGTGSRSGPPGTRYLARASNPNWKRRGVLRLFRLNVGTLRPGEEKVVRFAVTVIPFAPSLRVIVNRVWVRDGLSPNGNLGQSMLRMVIIPR
jgi:hypothetical protein